MTAIPESTQLRERKERERRMLDEQRLLITRHFDLIDDQVDRDLGDYRQKGAINDYHYLLARTQAIGYRGRDQANIVSNRKSVSPG